MKSEWQIKKHLKNRAEKENILNIQKRPSNNSQVTQFVYDPSTEEASCEGDSSHIVTGNIIHIVPVDSCYENDTNPLVEPELDHRLLPYAGDLLSTDCCSDNSNGVILTDECIGFEKEPSPTASGFQSSEDKDCISKTLDRNYELMKSMFSMINMINMKADSLEAKLTAMMNAKASNRVCVF